MERYKIVTQNSMVLYMRTIKNRREEKYTTILPEYQIIENQF